MAVKVVFRRMADADIERATDYIAEQSPRKAVEWAESIRAKCRSLGEHPERTPVYMADVRRMVAGSYLVVYRIANAASPGGRRVIVLRVLHAAMDIDGVFRVDD